MKSRKRKSERGRPAQVRVAFERRHLDAARRVLEQAGAPPIGDDDAAMALFTIGLGVLSGHYNGLLATRLREVHMRAFGADRPARFREAAIALHGPAAMAEIATAVFEGAALGTSGNKPVIQ